ncbi:MAG: AAA family ATPase, partial [Pseudomonadota bacterium]
MLRGLDIRDMLIIDRLELTFQSGLNVLTGETGAGKSILLDALGFVLGWRGRAELVREGAAQGEVTAWFELAPDHPAQGVLEAAGLPASDELILRRVNTREGRKTAWINDRRASGEVLRQLSALLVELHGQHDDRGLLNARGHRGLLDAFAGTEDLKARVRAAWTARREAVDAFEARRAALVSLRAEEDFLRHAVAELEALAPEPGEDAVLDQRRRMMQAGERVRQDIARAAMAIGGEGAERLLSDARRWLEDSAEHLGNEADPSIAALDRALSELADAQAGVEGVLEGLDFDPAEQEAVTDRLFALRELARKHKVLPDA